MKNDITSAVKNLRHALGDTQQAFANRLGLAISTVVRYELSRPPRGKSLAQLADVARSIGNLELAQVFSGAIKGERINTDNQLDSGVVQALIQNRGRGWLQKELETLIADAKAGGLILQYPSVFTDQHEPDQAMRIAYLEGLLVLLRLQVEGSAEKTLNRLAEERAKSTGESFPKAYMVILRENPELYERYNQEKQLAARGTSHEKSVMVSGTDLSKK